MRPPLLLRAGWRRTLNTAARGGDPDKRVRVAVVGTGRMGQLRLAGLQQLADTFELSAIIDPSVADAHTSRRLKHQYHAPTFESIPDASKVLADVDGVWIATPTPTHLDLIIQTLAHTGSVRAIGIEKPVAATVTDMDAAYDACFRRRVHIVCSFQRRFDPSYDKLRTLASTLGHIQSIHTVFRDHPCPPIEFLKTGGDPFHDLAVHDIDYVCNLLNEYPSRVYASGSSLSEELRNVGVMDKASVWLEFPVSGVVCTMDLSRRADYGYDQRIEVCGERGMLQVRNPATTTLVGANADSGERHDVGVHSFPQRFREAYLLELAHFADVVRGRAPPCVHWNAARMATAIAEAARLAAVHKKIVTIKYDRTRQDHANQDPYVEVQYEYY